MALDLFMVGIAVKDMEKMLTSYRHLGLAIPEVSEGQTHIPVNMEMKQGFTLFFDTRSFSSENTTVPDFASRYQVLFEYYLTDQATVERKYYEMIALGYESYRAPFIFANGRCFAFLYDPDGNVVLISGDAEQRTIS